MLGRDEIQVNVPSRYCGSETGLWKGLGGLVMGSRPVFTDDFREEGLPGSGPKSGKHCQLNRSIQQHPVRCFGNASAGEPAVWLHSDKT